MRVNFKISETCILKPPVCWRDGTWVKSQTCTLSLCTVNEVQLKWMTSLNEVVIDLVIFVFVKMFHQDPQPWQPLWLSRRPGFHEGLRNITEEAVFSTEVFTIYLSVPTLNVRSVLHYCLLLSLLEFPEGMFFCMDVVVNGFTYSIGFSSATCNGDKT